MKVKNVEKMSPKNALQIGHSHGKRIVNKKNYEKTSRPQLVPSIEDNDDDYENNHSSKHSLNDNDSQIAASKN